MKKSLKITFGVIIAILVLIPVIIYICNRVDKKNINKIETPSTFEYVALEDLIAEYSIEEAIDDEVFIITKEAKLYNHANLEGFLKGVRAEKKSNIRVIQEENSGIVQIIDLEYDGAVIKTSYKDGASQIITTNEYNCDDGYQITTSTVILNDGSEWNGCYVSNEATSEEVVLFGYVDVEAGKSEISGEVMESGDPLTIDEQ
jgi:asparagine N-glycosylation enzyme membrane subunit Stt3